MHEKEKLVREQRLGETVTKDYKGLEGKFGVILKNLGHPVVTQDSSLDITEWPDVYDLPDDSEIPTADQDLLVKEIGRIFDGLKFGVHLEISFLKEGRVPEKINEYYTKYNIEDNVLTVTYKSHPVYREVDSQLDCFVPGEWEKEIEKIYKLALKVKNNTRSEKIEAIQIEVKKDKIGFIRKLMEKWGI